MSEQLYEMLAIGLRYWFVLLGVLIVARTFLWLHKDRRDKHERIRRLPDAGMIGEMIVLRGSESLPEGSVLPLPHEGIVGSLRSADIYLPVAGVAREHLLFAFRPGKGIAVLPMYRCACECDGVSVNRKNRRFAPLLMHGSVLKAGEAVLQVSLFEGVDAGDATGTWPVANAPGWPAPGAYDSAAEGLREPPLPPAWSEPGGETPGDWQREPPDNPWVPRTERGRQDAQE
ncbi:MAG: hypothetical protein IKP40_07550 [Clostridia bacterium]|nr:hypothetical protein [Clostridia bacterium]